MEPKDDVSEPAGLEADIPGSSWRGGAEPLAAREGEEVGAAAALEGSAGDFFAVCCTGEEEPMGRARGESLKAAALAALGLLEDDLP